MARGHIQPHGPGKWRLFVYVGTDPVTGQRVKKTKVIAGTEKDAERALTALLAEVDGGHHGGTGGLTFGQLLDTFLEHKTLSVEQTTVDTWRRSAGYVTDKYRALPVAKVSVEHLEALYAHLLLKGRKRVPKTGPNAGSTRLDPQTVRNVHVVIYGAFELARRRKLGGVTVNPAADAEPPKVHKRIPTPADPSKLAAVFAKAEEIHPLLLPTFIGASICAGTRRSEMHGLRWTGVDFVNGRVTIRDVIVKAGKEWTVKPRTKTGEPRTVFLDPGTMALLAKVYDQAFANALTCQVDLAPDAFVFTDDVKGKEPWKPATTARRFTRCCEAAGLPKTTRIHDLRALCGTHLADEGVPIPVIGYRLGHTLNSTTADLYVGRIPDSDRQAAEVMGRLLDKVMDRPAIDDES